MYYTKRLMTLVLLILVSVFALNSGVAFGSEENSVWYYVSEGQIRDVKDLTGNTNQELNSELKSIKNRSIGELRSSFFEDQNKMTGNNINNLDSLEFGGDNEKKNIFVQKINEFCDNPSPSFFEDKMIVPYWSLDFRTTGKIVLSSNRLEDILKAYDESEKLDGLYIVFDKTDCFLFEIADTNQTENPYVLRPWGAQVDAAAPYRDIIWAYEEIERQTGSTITQIIYSETGPDETVILYMTSNGPVAQLIRDDKYVFLSEDECKVAFTRYVDDLDLQPGLQYGEGNVTQTAKSRANIGRIIIWVIAALAAAGIVLVLVLLLVKKHKKAVQNS